MPAHLFIWLTVDCWTHDRSPESIDWIGGRIRLLQDTKPRTAYEAMNIHAARKGYEDNPSMDTSHWRLYFAGQYIRDIPGHDIDVVESQLEKLVQEYGNGTIWLEPVCGC